MGNILVLTADIPFFPGKNGHDFFNLRRLAKHHHVAVVGPRHEWFPGDGVENLKKAIGATYLWPEPAATSHYAPLEILNGDVPGWVARLPRRFRESAWKKFSGLAGKSPEACDALGMLANCAPHLLQALAERRWQAIVVIQSSLGDALDYLPKSSVHLVYFHDVRSDYLRANPRAAADRSQLKAVVRQENKCAAEADAVGFVSTLDLERAITQLPISGQTGVGPIPVDTDYFVPAPEDWKKPAEPRLLFTGHLSHPPNVDAVLWFLEAIWPSVLEKLPAAGFDVAGLMPDAKLENAIAGAANCSLHPNVPDIRPLFWNASAYVVPMRFGGGVRQKIFEAWSMRVPVICTTMAAEGAPAIPGKNCLMHDSPAAIAESIVRALSGDGGIREVIDAASDTVQKTNSIDAAAPRFQEWIERTVRIRRSRPFRVLLDLRWMEIGRAGGTEQMSFELIDAMSRVDRINEFRLFCPRQTQSEWEFPRGFRHRFVDADKMYFQRRGLASGIANSLANGLGKYIVQTAAMQTLKFYRELDFDIVHSICSYSHPEMAIFPNVLTMHDIQHVWYPENFTPENWKEREKLYRDSCETAAHIITISEFTRRDVHEKYGVPLDKMTTIWNIPSRLAWQRPKASDERRILSRLRIRARFLFFPGHCWPHKNHAGLIDAIHQIRDELPEDIQLIMTGGPLPDDHPAAVKIHDYGLQDRIRHLGFRSPREIRVLFYNAHALVFPSFFEGFGMPVAEAIIAGCPVACSNVTSLPEIAGDAAAYFDPADVSDMAAKILAVSTNEQLRDHLRAESRKQRLAYSARKVAIKTLAVYKRVFDESFA